MIPPRIKHGLMIERLSRVSGGDPDSVPSFKAPVMSFPRERG